MNDEHDDREFDKLESPLDAALDAAVRTLLAETVPDESIVRVKVRAKQLSTSRVVPAPAGSAARYERFATRTLFGSRALLGTVIAGAVLLALAIGSNALFDRSASQAFAQVIEKVKSANSVRFRMVTRFDRQPEVESRFLIEGNRLRGELSHGTLIQIIDFDRSRVLYLDTSHKLAESTDLSAKKAEELANPLDQLRRAKSNDAESIGEDVLDGRRCLVYRLPKFTLLGMPGTTLLWVDAKTGLPAKIDLRDKSSKHTSEARLDEFVWNEPVDAQLLSLDVPAGYQSGNLVPTPRQEQPLPSVASLDAPNVSRDGILSRDRVPRRIVWSPDGKTLTALMKDPESAARGGRRDNELRQWDVATGKLRWRKPVEGAAFVAGSSDGKMLAITVGKQAQLLDAASGDMTRRMEMLTVLPPISFSPDNKFLAGGIEQWAQGGGKEAGGVQILDAVTGTIVQSTADDKTTTFVRYSVDGKFVASSSNMGPVKLWDAKTGELARLFRGTTAAFSPKGDTIACTWTEWKKGEPEGLGTVNLYDLKTAKLVRLFACEKPTATVWLLSVAFSPDGRWLAAASWDGTVTLWDVATGNRQKTLVEHGGVHSVAFSPNGSFLATGSEDKFLRLWKLADLLPSQGQEK
jgi:WD40 repeat protein